MLGHEENLAPTEILTEYAVFYNVDRTGQAIKIERSHTIIELAEVLVYGSRQPETGG